jgi:hypothetical protein
MNGARQLLLTFLCLLALLPATRVAAQVEEPQPLPAVEAPSPPPAAQRPVRQPTPPRNAATRPAAPATATAAAPDALSAGEAQRLLHLLQDDAQRGELLRTLRALSAATGGAAPAPTGAAAPPATGTPPTTPEGQAAATPPPAEEAILAPNTLGAQLLQGASQRLSALSEQMVGTVRAVADLPSVVAWFSSMARDPVTQYRVRDAAWKLILVLGLGLLCEWAMSRALTRARDRLDSLAPEEGVAYSWLRKVPLVVARLGLDLLPIAAFAVVSYGLIGAVQPVVTTELVMLTINNAYMASRAVMVASRMLLSPASPMLRLLPVADETAAYITIWLRRITVVIVVGYAVAEAGLQFGLPWSAYDSILRVCMLLVTMFLVIVILQNRAAVSEVLRAPPLPEGTEPEPTRRMLRAVRDRAAEIWHFIAIAWLIAAWGVWALEVQGGFWRLIRVSLMTLVVLGGARLVDMAVRRLIQRAFRITPDLALRYPGLEPRANRYLPVLKGAFSFFIGGIALLLLLEVWGLESFSWFGQGKLGSRLVGSIASMGLTILVAMAAWEAANAAIERHLSRLSRDAKAARSARVRTLLPMLRTALMITILVVVAFIFLTEIGGERRPAHRRCRCRRHRHRLRVANPGPGCHHRHLPAVRGRDGGGGRGAGWRPGRRGGTIVDPLHQAARTGWQPAHHPVQRRDDRDQPDPGLRLRGDRRVRRLRPGHRPGAGRAQGHRQGSARGCEVAPGDPRRPGHPGRRALRGFGRRHPRAAEDRPVPALGRGARDEPADQQEVRRAGDRDSVSAPEAGAGEGRRTAPGGAGAGAGSGLGVTERRADPGWCHELRGSPPGSRNRRRR